MLELLWVSVALVGYFALLAIGLNVQQGLAGLSNFGIVGFFALGAYAMAVFTKDPAALSITETMFAALDLPFPLALLLTGLVGALVAWLLARILDASSLDPLFVAVLTLVFAEVLFLVFSTQKGVVNGFNGVRGIHRPLAGQVGGFAGYDRFLAILLLALGLLAAAGYRYLAATPYGRALRAMRDDPDAVEAFGYDIRHLRTGAFVLGSTVMVVAGALWPMLTTVVEPSAFRFEVTMLVWASLVVGGLGNALGPLIGAVLLVGLVQNGSRLIEASELSVRLVPLIKAGGIGLILILFVLLRPEGVWRERPRKLSNYRR